MVHFVTTVSHLWKCKENKCLNQTKPDIFACFGLRALLLHSFIPNLTGNQVYFKVLSYSLSQSLIIHLWQYIYQKNKDQQ